MYTFFGCCQFYAEMMEICPVGLSNPSSHPRVSVQEKRKKYYSWIPPGDFPAEDGSCPAKWIQTVFISQNYVSPLWLCTKSNSLICCIDSHSSLPPLETYGARLSLSQRYALSAHATWCVALHIQISTQHERWLWQMSRLNERHVIVSQ